METKSGRMDRKQGKKRSRDSAACKGKVNNKHDGSIKFSSVDQKHQSKKQEEPKKDRINRRFEEENKTQSLELVGKPESDDEELFPVTKAGIWLNKKDFDALIYGYGMESDDEESDDDESDEENEAIRANIFLLLDEAVGANGHLKGYDLKTEKAECKKGKEVAAKEKSPAVDYVEASFLAMSSSP